MATNGVTIKIKGDISNLESELKKAGEVVSSVNNDIAKSEKELAKTKQDIANQNKVYEKTLSSLITKLKQENASEKEIAKNRREANLAHLNNIATLKQEQKTIESSLSAMRETIRYNQTDIANTKEKIARKQKLIEVDKRYNQEQQKAIATAKEEYRRTYVNTKATNAYEDALKKLNHQKDIGAIDSKQYATALSKEKQNLKEAELAAKKHGASLETGTNAIVRHWRQLETLALMLYTVKTAYDKTIGSGIETLRSMESNTMGVAALMSANTRMTDSFNNTLTPLKKYQMGMAIAKDTMKELRIESLKTPATFKEITEVYQQAIGQTMGASNAFGESVKVINKNTIQLAKDFTNVAGSIGMDMTKVKEEIRSALTGNVSTDSIISTMIFGSPTEANEAIRNARTRVNGLVELFDLKFKPFRILEDQKSFDKGLNQLKGAWEITMADMVEKSGMFQDITDLFYNMAQDITKDSDNIVKDFDSIYNGMKKIFSYAEEVLMAFVAWRAIAKYNKITELSIAQTRLETQKATLASKIYTTQVLRAKNATQLLGTAARSTGKALKGMALANAPLAALMITYEAYNLILDDNIEKENQLAEITSRKIRDLEKLTNAQLKYGRVSIKDKLNELRTELADMEGSYKTKKILHLIDEKDTLKFENNVATIKQKIKELQKTYQEYGKVLNEKTDATGKLELAKQQAELLTKLNFDEKLHKDLLKYSTAQESELTKALQLRKKVTDDIAENQKKLSNKENQNPFAQQQIKKWIEDQRKLLKNVDQKIVEEKLKAKKLELEAQYKIAIADNDSTAAKKKQYEILQNNVKASKELWQTSIKEGATQDIINKRAIKYATDKIALNKEDERIRQKELADKIKLFNLSKKSVKRNMDINGDSFISGSEYSSVIDQITAEFEKINSQLLATDEVAKAKLLENFTKAKEDLAKEFENKTFEIDIKLNGFDEVSNGIANIVNGLTDIVNENEKIATQQSKLSKLDKNSLQYKEEKNKLDKMTIKNNIAQIGTYANMSDAMGSFYAEDDARKKKQAEVSKALHITQMAMQVAEMVQSTAFTGLFVAQEGAKATAAATTAVATAASSSPWTGFATAAAMIALMASIGISLGGKGSTNVNTSYDAFSAQAENMGTGSVLGDTSAQSESIKNSLSVLSDIAKPEFRLISQMNDSLISIDQALSGVSAGIIQQGGFIFGEGFNPSLSQGASPYSNEKAMGMKFSDTITKAVSAGTVDLFQKVGNIFGVSISNDAISKIGGIFSGANVSNWLADTLFGSGTTVSTAITDAGITFQKQLIEAAIGDLSGQAYQTILTYIHTDGGLLGGSSDTALFNTKTQSLATDTQNQFELILGSLYDTMFYGGEILGTASQDIKNELSNFYVDIGKISLKGKTGSQIQERITAIFNKIADDMAKDAFPALVDFQKIGEGTYETLTRVSAGMQEADYYISKLGQSFQDINYKDIINKQGIVSIEALKQSIIKFDEAVYGSGNGVVDIISLINSSAQDLYDTYTTLSTVRDKLGFIGTPTSALTSSMLLGADGAQNLSDALGSYFDNFLTDEEKLQYNTTAMAKEFAKLNLTMPNGIQGFKNLLASIDTTTDAGQELYGRVITLSDGFASLADDMGKSMSAIQDSIKSFIGMIDSIQQTIDKLLGNTTGANSTDALIKTYWDKRERADQLLALGAGLTSSQQTELQGLVGDINNLSTSIQSASVGDNTKITSELVNELIGLKQDLDLENKILNVNIVGINSTLGLNYANNLITSLPSFDVGTTNVPRDMVAQIHKNETIIPAPFASGIRSGALTLGNNSDIISAINKNTEEVARMNSTLVSIEKNTDNSHNILSEAQYEQRPLLVKVSS
jgi:hypothetical protein